MTNNAAAAGSLILEDVVRLARLITDAQYDAEPQWRAKYGSDGIVHAQQDTRYHLIVLAQALLVETPELVLEYARWAGVVLHSRGIQGAHLDSCIYGYVSRILRAELPLALSDVAAEYADAAALELRKGELAIPPTFLPEAGELEPLARRYLDALLAAEVEHAQWLMRNAREQGVPAEQLSLRILTTTQREVGRLWQINQISVAQEHLCTAATQRMLSELFPVVPGETKISGVIVVACVGGELHDIGCRMVSDFMRSAGWVTYFVGQSTPPKGIVEMVEMTGAHILALSCTTSLNIKLLVETIAAVRRHKATAGVRIMVGGRVFENAPALPEKLGADGYARDAVGARLLAESFR
ncbi:B12-binding domain-containing protein [soil metagenome]